MNRDWVLLNLREAEHELRETISQIESTAGYDTGEFSVAVQHVYHHLNTAWNARNASQVAVQQCAEEDFYRWRQFPVDVYLGP